MIKLTATHSAGSPWDAIFDYLNLNRHKFDEHGNFDPSPDKRDYIPPALVTDPDGIHPSIDRILRRSKAKTRKYSGLIPEGQGPDDVAQDRNRYEAKDFADGVRYDADKCQSNWDLEQKLCERGGYSSGCWDRAMNRHNKCRDLGHYDGLPIWTFQDETGQPQGAEDLDRKTKPQSPPPPEPENDSDEQRRAGAISFAYSDYARQSGCICPRSQIPEY